MIEKKEALYLALPVLIIVGGVLIYPAVNTFYLSTEGFSSINPFVKILSSAEFYSSLSKSVLFVGGTIILHLIAGLGLALLVNSAPPGYKILQYSIFTPWILSPVVAALVWKWVLNPNIGLLNAFLNNIGIAGANWLSSPNLAMVALIVANTWKGMALAFLFLLANLKQIPDTLYESARIDGANWFQQLTRLTIPLVMPTLLVLTILFTIGTFNLIAIIMIMTGGGPFGTTNVLALFMYRKAFVFLDFNAGAAIAVLLFTINLSLSIFYFQFLERSGG